MTETSMKKYEYLAVVKHQGKNLKIKIYADDEGEAQTTASMQGRVRSIRLIQKLSAPGACDK